MKTIYDANLTPNAYIVIAFTVAGPENRGQFTTERAARKIFESLPFAAIHAQTQMDTNIGASAGQHTAWTERNF